MKKLIPIVLVCWCLSGCAILFNLDEVFELKDYGDEKDAQHALVKSINDRYDTLAKVYDEVHISEYKNKDSFIHSFGEPILKKNLSDGRERWLYRHAVYRLSKDKIYVYFDRNGKQITSEKLPCSKFF